MAEHNTLREWRYVPNQEDLLWLLRAVQAEGEPRTHVAAAMVNRFAYLSASAFVRDEPYDTLAGFVRAYSQPVNPRWMRGGDKWEARWETADDAGKRRLVEDHRRRQRHSARTAFAPSTRRAAERALTTRPELQTVTDFAADRMVPSPGLTRVRKGSPTENALYSVDPRWRGYQVGTERVLTPRADCLIWMEKIVLIAYRPACDIGAGK